MEHKHRTWLCTVLFLDIVGYSKLSVERQISVREHFYAMVEDALNVCSKIDCITVDAGDGMAICYLGDPEHVLLMAISLRDEFQIHSHAAEVPYSVRLGINLGPIKIVELQGERRVVGDAINVAQRIMDFAKPNQLLVSRSYYDVVSCVSEDYLRMFNYLGLHADKHVRKHAVYEVLPEGSRDDGVKAQEAGEMVLQHVSGNLEVPAAFEEKVLSIIEERLAGFVGPMARILVKNAAREARDIEDLFKILADDVPSEEGRRQFLDSQRTLH